MLIRKSTNSVAPLTSIQSKVPLQFYEACVDAKIDDNYVEDLDKNGETPSSSSKKICQNTNSEDASPATTSYNSISITPKPNNEDQRLEILKKSQLLSLRNLENDMYPFCALARRNIKVPIAFFTLIDIKNVYLKAKIGIQAERLPRERSPCAHTLCNTNTSVLCVPDLLSDERFATSAVSTAIDSSSSTRTTAVLRFYAGIPISLHGVNIGTFCIADTVPKPMISVKDSLILQDIAAIIAKLLHEKEIRMTTTTSCDSAQFMISMMQSLKPALAQVAYHHKHLQQIVQLAQLPTDEKSTDQMKEDKVGLMLNQIEGKMLLQKFVDELAVFRQALNYLSKEMEGSLKLGYFSFRHIAPSTSASIVATSTVAAESKTDVKGLSNDVNKLSCIDDLVGINQQQQEQFQSSQFQQYDLDSWLDELKTRITMPSYYIPRYHEVTWRMNYHSGTNSTITEVNTDILAVVVSLLLGRAMLRWKKLRVLVDVSFTQLTLGVHDGVHSSSCRLYLRVTGTQTIHSRRQHPHQMSSRSAASGSSLVSEENKKDNTLLTSLSQVASHNTNNISISPSTHSHEYFNDQHVVCPIARDSLDQISDNSCCNSGTHGFPISDSTSSKYFEPNLLYRGLCDSHDVVCGGPMTSVIEEGVILVRKDNDLELKDSDEVVYIDEELLRYCQPENNVVESTTDMPSNVTKARNANGSVSESECENGEPHIASGMSISSNSMRYHKLVEHFLRDSQFDKINYELIKQCDLFVIRFILQAMRGGINHQYKEIDEMLSGRHSQSTNNSTIYDRRINETMSDTSSITSHCVNQTRIRGEEFTLWIPCKIHWNHGPMKDDEALLKEVYGLDSKLPTIISEEQRNENANKSKPSRMHDKFISPIRSGNKPFVMIHKERVAAIQENTSCSGDEDGHDSSMDPTLLTSGHPSVLSLVGVNHVISNNGSSMKVQAISPATPTVSPFSLSPFSTSPVDNPSQSNGTISQIMTQVSKTLYNVISAVAISSSSRSSSSLGMVCSTNVDISNKMNTNKSGKSNRIVPLPVIERSIRSTANT